MNGLLTSIIVGFVIGSILGLLGGGGGLIAIPSLIYLLHFPFRVAVGISLALVSVGAMPSVVLYLLKRQIVWKLVLLMGGTGIVGARLGGFLSAFIPKEATLALLIAMMALSAFKMLKPGGVSVPDADAVENKLSGLPLLLSGFGIGTLTGLVGVGGGFLLVPALTFFGKLDARSAIATSLLIISLNALSGVTGYIDILPLGNSDFWFLGVGTLAGSILGFWANLKLSQQQLKKGFGLLLVFLAGVLLLFPPQK